MEQKQEQDNDDDLAVLTPEFVGVSVSVTASEPNHAKVTACDTGVASDTPVRAVRRNRTPSILRLLPKRVLQDVNRLDAVNTALMRFYRWPIVGRMYRRRVEMCLDECTGGQRILEVGFGVGLTFPNLTEEYDEIHGVDLDANVHEVAAMHRSLGIATHLENGNVLDLRFRDGAFDTVLLISILEHLRPEELSRAFAEIKRVLKPGGQVVYGVPIERPFMVLMFRMLGWDCRKLHFSTEHDVRSAARAELTEVRVEQMQSYPPIFGAVYEVGHFVSR
ncbi:MAG: class I SAM-dependent methyltransferase [Planctomycetes bacterium]|nr:class I SAM-dependent methyltransferase [Planctomycetota bacterium]